MSIYITTEDTADLPVSLIKPDSAILPMSYNVCGENYNGIDKKLTPKEFYDICRKAKSAQDLPTTSMVNSYEAYDFFKPILLAGHDIIHIGFSDKLSGMYDQICIAQKELAAEFPERKITVISSYLASMVEGLLYVYLCNKRDEGASYDELVALGEKQKVACCARFIVDDLKHLYRTGRASKTQAYFGEKLQIKPVLYVNGNGELIPIAKSISRKKSIKQVIEMAEEDMLPMSEQFMIAVGHADCAEEANHVIKELKADLKFDNIVSFDIGPVIGSHVGAGMMCIIYSGKSRWVPQDKSPRDV